MLIGFSPCDRPNQKIASPAGTAENHGMAQTYTSLYLHIVFSTKDREPVLRPDFRERVWRYVGGIARKEKIKAIEIGGTADHVHALLSVAPTMAPASIVQTLKGNTSKWINESLGLPCRFEWQEGYGAFSVSYSQIDKTVAYIQNQERHHRRKTFQEEYLGFLKKHRIEYDERYIWT
jgi:REP element-mobilizing transposase RayT